MKELSEVYFWASVAQASEMHASLHVLVPLTVLRTKCLQFTYVACILMHFCMYLCMCVCVRYAAAAHMKFLNSLPAKSSKPEIMI